MSNPYEASKGLEQASQKHEKEIVIELGSDRILHYIGVYVVILLAILSKLSEVVGDKLSCYPASNITVDVSFIAYAKSFCWESFAVSSTNEMNTPSIVTSCNLQHNDLNEKNLLQNPAFFKSFLQWMPYGMLFEAFLFALPSVWWHFRVGARLMGHLKFMKLLLDDIYNAVKPKERGVYQKDSAYDSDSYFLDGWVKYRPEYKRAELKRSAEPVKSATSVQESHNIPHTKVENDNDEKPADGDTPVDADAQTDKRDKNDVSNNSNNNCVIPINSDNEVKQQQGIMRKLILGEMLDRHLFSMLCFENFSSLEQLPYILSVYKVTETTPEDSSKGHIGSKTKCILRLVCNNRNFNGIFLVRSYLMKHAFGFLVSVMSLAVSSWLLVVLGSDGWTSGSFRCDVIYHEEKCMVCTINRKTDLIAYLTANIVVNVFYLIISFSHWIFIRKSKDRASSYYFEEMCDTGSVALNKAK
uniref:uncharacterized protein LOC120326526 n=1 Tax=Styela clava TaxID=7725 RepID=UPI00193AB3E4|nr:uncharacterized protein LOC120326526 [Styela clava]